jgi:hypothetical protein
MSPGRRARRCPGRRGGSQSPESVARRSMAARGAVVDDFTASAEARADLLARRNGAIDPPCEVELPLAGAVEVAGEGDESSGVGPGKESDAACAGRRSAADKDWGRWGVGTAQIDREELEDAVAVAVCGEEQG